MRNSAKLIRALPRVGRVAICAIAAASCGSTARADAEFDGQIAPIVIRNCLGCHQTNDPSGGLDLSRRSAALAGGESGTPAIAPGKPGESYLIERVANGEMPPEGKGKRLSAQDVATLRGWIAHGAPWPEERTLSVLEFTTEKRGGRDFWSLSAPPKPALPPASGGQWVRTPIDAFILRRLQEAGLSPNPDAPRPVLIRRLMLDLLGLPPSPEEIQSFVADPAPDAYERLVERLLNSPRYGERWARHWLDVVRFAESQGYETNVARANAWPYRDYVIGALNADTPYPQFIAEQIAGDQLGADAATGFLVGGAHDVVASPDPELTAQQRLNDLDDMTSTVGLAFLGLSVGCAKCHDHKFDAITQQDYYALQAALSGVQHSERQMRPLLTPEQQQTVEAWRDQLAQAKAAQAALASEYEPLAQPAETAEEKPPRRASVFARGNVERFAPVPARWIRFTVLATNNLEPCIDEWEIFSAESPGRNVALASARATAAASSVYEDGNSSIHQLAHINDGRYGNGRSWISKEPGGGWVQIELPQVVMIDRMEWARDREGAYRDRLPIQYKIETSVEPGAWQVVADSSDRAPFDPAADAPTFVPDRLPPPALERYRQLESQERALRTRLAPLEPRAIYAGTFSQPGTTYRLHRGDPLAPRDEVVPAGVAAVGPAWKLPADSPEAQRRMELARWLGSPENPLTARVMVNRIWHYHFGHGLVGTPGDFGFNGERPSHPDLLDWLASHWIAEDWRPKALHRLIVLSSAYRQSSDWRAPEAAIDADARLLWRFPPHRLEAEPIRDCLLAVSGALDLAMGGPGFDVFEPNANYVKVYTPKRRFTPAEWRRMIYQNRPRMRQDDVFGGFDCPDASSSAARRNVSTTAPQSLGLWNGPFVLQQSEIFAARLAREAGNDVSVQVGRAFQLAYGREPTEEERIAGRLLVEAAGLTVFCRSVVNANEFVYVR